jgi:hypothetical protein
MRELLEAGRGASVAGYDFEQGLNKHLALIEAGAPLPHWAEGLKPAATGTGGAAAAAAAGSGLIAWIAVPLALVAVSSAVLLVANQSPAPAPVSTQGAPAAVSNAKAAPAAAAQPATHQAGAPVVLPTPVVVHPAHPSTSAAPRGAHAKRPAPLAPSKPVQAPFAQPSAAPAESTSAKNAAPATSGELFATAQPAVATTTPSAPAAAPAQAQDKQPQQAARAPEPPQAPAQDDARLEREMSMLAVAQRALQTDPERALSLARQGEAEFSGSMFTQERQQVVLLALVKLGRMDEARRLAKPYLARYPHGPFSERVRHALATGKVER